MTSSGYGSGSYGAGAYGSGGPVALPTPTKATVGTPYVIATKRVILLVPTIATPSAPTSAELTAGMDYAPSITGLGGWSYSADDVDAADYGSRYNKTVPGVTSSDASSWTLKANFTGTDARSALTIDQSAFVVFGNEGLTATSKIDVWPVRVKSVYTVQGARADLATIMCEFSIPDTPLFQIATPTA